MKDITIGLDLGENGQSLTDFFVEKFWERGLLPARRSIRITVFPDGKMDVKAKTLEIDGALLDRVTVWDLQAIVDGL